MTPPACMAAGTDREGRGWWCLRVATTETPAGWRCDAHVGVVETEPRREGGTGMDEKPDVLDVLRTLVDRAQAFQRDANELLGLAQPETSITTENAALRALLRDIDQWLCAAAVRGAYTLEFLAWAHRIRVVLEATP